MEHRMTILWMIALMSIMLGSFLYILYKHAYEKKINQVLEGIKVKAVEPKSVMKGYVVLCLIVFLIAAVLTPEHVENSDCSLIYRVSLSRITSEEKEKLYKELLPKVKGDTYTMQVEEVEDHLKLYFATNKKKYAYIIEYKIDREIQENEMFHVSINGAASTFSVEELDGDTLGVLIEGTFKEGCQSITENVVIYNFCEGKNLYPVDIHETITVGNGGITR